MVASEETKTSARAAGMSRRSLELRVAQPGGNEPTRPLGRQKPQLMRGSRRPDVEQMTRLVVLRIRRFVRLHEHDVVEFEPLDLADVRDVDAGPKREILIRDAAEMRGLGLRQPGVVEVGLLGV